MRRSPFHGHGGHLAQAKDCEVWNLNLGVKRWFVVGWEIVIDGFRTPEMPSKLADWLIGMDTDLAF